MWDFVPNPCWSKWLLYLNWIECGDRGYFIWISTFIALTNKYTMKFLRNSVEVAKCQLILKAKCQAMNSSKRRTNELVFTNMQCVFIRFLEESSARIFFFEIIWPLHSYSTAVPAYFLKEVCLLFNFPMIQLPMSKKKIRKIYKLSKTIQQKWQILKYVTFIQKWHTYPKM